MSRGKGGKRFKRTTRQAGKIKRLRSHLPPWWPRKFDADDLADELSVTRASQPQAERASSPDSTGGGSAAPRSSGSESSPA